MYNNYCPSHTVIHRGVEILSQLLDILAYSPCSCPAPIYFVYTLVLNHRTFTRIYHTMFCMIGCYHTTDHTYTCTYILARAQRKEGGNVKT